MQPFLYLKFNTCVEGENYVEKKHFYCSDYFGFCYRFGWGIFLLGENGNKQVVLSESVEKEEDNYGTETIIEDCY